MAKDIVLDGKVIGKNYGVVKSLCKYDDDDDDSFGFNAASPSVIYDGKVYKMWYRSSESESGRFSIFYATSTDGKDWTKHGVVLLLNIDGKYDTHDKRNPTVIFDGEIYHMWYGVFDCIKYRLHHATSKDGVNWDDYGVIINLGDDISRHQILSQSVIFDGIMYKMWYNVYNSYNRNYTMYYTTSKDGITWDKYELVTLLDPSNNSNILHAHSSSIIFDCNIYKMLYSASDGSRYRICYATSEDGISWTKHGVVIPLGDEGDSDNENIDTPFILLDGAIYKVWYCGFNGSVYKLHYAELSELNLIK